MKNYLIEANKRAQDRKEYMLYNVPLYIIHSFPKVIDVNTIIDLVKKKLPADTFNGLDAIYVGEFKDLKDREIQAMFKDSAIWLSSDNIKSFMTEEVIADNIVHEVAHLLEDLYPHFIYFDNKVEQEYNSKKHKLMTILKEEGYSVFIKLFFNEEYLKEFDNLLYKHIGYDKLALFSLGLFISPYSITTIREYFASGFQMFFSEEVDYLREISPVLYHKIKKLMDETKDENNSY